MNGSSAYYNPEAIGQIAAAGLRIRRIAESTIAGRHRSPLRGVSPEFADHRSYTPGDDLRSLDWRVFARSDRFFVKRFEEESSLRAHIVLDASASMAYHRSGPSKFHVAATLAVSLAATLIKQRDAVAFTTFDCSGTSQMPMSSSAAQLGQLCSALEMVVPCGATDAAAAVASVADQMSRRGLIVLISDLFTDLESLYQSLGKAQYLGHELLVFQVLDRDEVELPFDGAVEFEHLESDELLLAEPRSFRRAYRQAMQQFLAGIENRCHRVEIDLLTLFTDQSIGQVVSQFLRRRWGIGQRSSSMSTNCRGSRR